MVVMVVGGPNHGWISTMIRGEFFTSSKGMLLKIAEGRQIMTCRSAKADLHAATACATRHAPTRSLGLVVDPHAHPEPSMASGSLQLRRSLASGRGGDDEHRFRPPPLFDTSMPIWKRAAGSGALHPGREPPIGWARINHLR